MLRFVFLQHTSLANRSRLLVDFQPMQREFGRLRLNGTVMSKRDIKKLIDSNVVRGWDDPRLYTLAAIRRRGIPPGAILSFIHELGVTTTQSSISIKRFEQTVRTYLERTVSRLMLVLDPLRVTIEDAIEQDIDVPFLPHDQSMGSRKIRLTRSVYIDRSDFREVDSKDYYRLAPGKSVGLLHTPYPVKAVSLKKDADGTVVEVNCVFERNGTKPKAYIQWVSDDSPLAEVRIHSALFKSDQPKLAVGGIINDVNPESETIWPNAMIEEGFYEVSRRAPWPKAEGEMPEPPGPESIRFQATRVAYFVSHLLLYLERSFLTHLSPIGLRFG